MFCYQCEQTAKGEGCMKSGVCGKQPDVAALQDLLTYALTGLSVVAVAGRNVGIVNKNIDVFTCEALFTTVTNVNFDPERIVGLIKKTVTLRDEMIEEVRASSGKVNLVRAAVNFTPANTLEEMVNQGEEVGLKSYPAANADILSLKHILLFGIRGIAAYMDHARILGREDDTVYAFIHEGLAELTNERTSLDEALNLVLKCGEVNLKTMELLDECPYRDLWPPCTDKSPPRGKKGEGDSCLGS